MNAEIKALARCADKCARSMDGRAQCGALRKCINDLRKLGTSESMAEQCAHAMVRIGAHIGFVAATRQP